ncbi:nucleotidyltransferase domain-containing protein [uncultured Paraglaciecola sp.]|uniref:nucleotidyltransferase domain-containing protein n=1 Tax=uncultured Paraglaciecola sp. TaxID=1765024 RepID=UPI00263569C7|nr:nucleotidyltransferase domain-containing protein [uncultured Paraglaciecola sp.]
MKYPNTLAQAHKRLLIQIIETFSQDHRILGIGASGSYASDTMDKFSDLDLVIAIDPIFFAEVMRERFQLIDKVDGKIAAFTGEHVGEPRLVIALYEPDLVHVDFKFVSLPDTTTRVDDTKVLWERDGQLSTIYNNSNYQYPQPDIQWIENRFWIWIHYGATKIARGEYFEAIEFLSFLRTTALSPLALKQQGLTPSGVRTIEKRLPAFTSRLKETVATPDREALIPAFQMCISLYIELRDKEQVTVNAQAQKLALEYFNQEILG